MDILNDIVALLERIFTLDALMAVLWVTLVAVLSIMAGLFVTQFFKFSFPKVWTQKKKTIAARTVAALISFAVAVMLLPTALGVVFGLLAGFAAPWSYRLVTGLLYEKWPFLKTLLSMESK